MSNDKPAWQSRRVLAAVATVVTILIVAWRPEFALHETAIQERLTEIFIALALFLTAQDTIVGTAKAIWGETVDITDMLKGKGDK